MKNNLLDKKSRFKKEKKKKAFIKFKWKNSYASRNLEKRKKKFQYNIRICICDPMAKQTKKALTWIISMWLSEAYIKNASKDFWLELRDERDIYFLMYKYITGPKAYMYSIVKRLAYTGMKRILILKLPSKTSNATDREYAQRIYL